MAAADMTVNAKIATIECEATPHKITIDSAGGSICNVGSYPVFVSQTTGGDLFRDGLQHDGEIELAPGDSISLPADARFFRHQCAAGQTSKLWFIPALG